MMLALTGIEALVLRSVRGVVAENVATVAESRPSFTHPVSLCNETAVVTEQYWHFHDA